MDGFFDTLEKNYPSDCERLDKELETLKRKLESDNDSECSPSKKLKTNSDKNDCKPRAYVCSQCGNNYLKKHHLDRHILSHEKRYSCDVCSITFTREDNLTRHKKEKHTAVKAQKQKQQKLPHQCSCCNQTFLRRFNMDRHRKKCHSSDGKKQFKCNHCDSVFENYDRLFHHVTRKHPLDKSQHGGGEGTAKVHHKKARKEPNNRHDDTPSTMNGNSTSSLNQNKHPEEQRVAQDETALNEAVVNRTIIPQNEELYDLLLFFANSREPIGQFLRQELQKHGIKWYLSTQVEMYRETPEGTVITDSPHFRSLTYTTLSNENISEHELNEAFQKMSASLESYVRNASGWNIRKVIHLKIHTVIYKPLGGSSYIELPLSLKKTRSILNVENNDNKCFTWSILSAIHAANENPEKVEKYTDFEHDLNMSDIAYPVSVSKIDTFERQNLNISVNVFAFDNNEILPLRITKNVERKHHVNLLLLSNKQTSHYCLIKDLNKFLYRTTKKKCRKHFCPYCLQSFNSKAKQDAHTSYCSSHGPQKVELPFEGQNDSLEFSDFEKEIKVPFVIYADFECLNVKVHSCEPTPEHSHTTPKSLLKPISFGYKVVCQNPKYTKPTVIYRGADASQKLIECLLKETEEIQTILKNVEPLKMSEKDEETFLKATHCSMCHKAFGPNDKKVKHHLHFYVPENDNKSDNTTSNFKGACHNRCNLLAKKARFVPCILHNLKHFDGHILMQSLGNFREYDIKCIATNTQDYISFSVGNLRFIDSFQFMNSSLENLVESLASDNADAFRYFHEEFSHGQSQLLLRKGIYPYDYIDSERRFEEEHLPPIEAFYSEIKRECISQSEYEHASNVYKTFSLNNLGEYHDLYLKTDVVLLCDVFEQFRNVCMEQYGLDPCHFYTSPGLSWSACLKKSRVCLELLCDIDQLNFIERGMRGGISQISHRYQRANNPLLGEKGYDPKQDTSWIQLYDVNNLYGSVMTSPLATGMFRFLSQEEIKDLDILSVPENNATGYICEVSMACPKSEHDKFADYPLAPEKRQIKNDELSPYAKHLWKKTPRSG